MGFSGCPGRLHPGPIADRIATQAHGAEMAEVP